MIREFSTPALSGGIGFASYEFTLGISILWARGEVSLHLGPFYAWLCVGRA